MGCSSSSDLNALIPELVQPARALVDLAGRAGVLPRITSTLRTHAEQKCLYRRFQAGLNPYPVAVPGTSSHEYGYAFDMVVAGEENQRDLGAVWQQWGGIWGGLRDPVHFEYPGFRATDHVAPPDQATGVGEFFRSAQATVMDTILGFVPGVGQAELVATLVQVFGLSDSEAVQVLASPYSEMRKAFPGAFEFLFQSTPFALLARSFGLTL